MVYDCIDELAAFANSPPELPDRERELLRAADLVLTSGPALQAARQRLHGKVRCVPNGVDAAHFDPLRQDAGSAQAVEARRRLGAWHGPRLGYCGVVDERIDLSLLAALAEAHPDWQIVIAGPVLKVDAAALPPHPNILWLGHQPYVRLPALVGAWDVSLLPFAHNRITRFINPVKTLEYLAAGKPVVSVPLPDVLALHAGTVSFADGAPAFVAACEAALAEAPAARDRRLAAQRRTLAEAGWDARVEAIVALLAEDRPAAAAQAA